jgi:signal transduction histidine kinase
VKYSKATTITVDLQTIKQDLLIKISDDGVGFDTRSNIGRGNGLSNLIDYGKEGYMKVDIDSALGKGTSIKIYIPQL